jgi:hypothetical protein
MHFRLELTSSIDSATQYSIYWEAGIEIFHHGAFLIGKYTSNCNWFSDHHSPFTEKSASKSQYLAFFSQLKQNRLLRALQGQKWLHQLEVWKDKEAFTWKFQCISNRFGIACENIFGRQGRLRPEAMSSFNTMTTIFYYCSVSYRLQIFSG